MVNVLVILDGASETAIAALLGRIPDGPVDRGLIGAAARRIGPGPGERAWRVDLLGGHRLLLIAAPRLPRLEAEVPLRVWPGGLRPPKVLDTSTVITGAARAAVAAIEDGGLPVVVHVGGADEAAHARNRAAKIACIEAADRELIWPLADALLTDGGLIRVRPDHGCDPATGKHVAGPVPCVTWGPATVRA
jgi:hypothetical protein